MGGDDKDRVFPADFLADLKSKECEPDAEAVAKLDALDARDGFERFWSGEAAVVTSILDPRAPAIPSPAKPDIPLEAATEPSESGSTADPTNVFECVPLRSTKRKAGRFSPNCFGSQFLHDPESADCGPCEFSEGCKKAIVDEMPLLEVARTTRKAHFKPSGNPKQREFLRGLFRGYHLGKYRKALKNRRQKDRGHQRDKRANPSAEILIEREYQKRLAALRSAVARPGKNKFLQQLYGREAMIIAVWEAQQHARLAHGANASDAQVAKAFNEMIGGDGLSRHQARSYRRLFRSLEQSPHAWKRFVTSPDEKSA